MAISAAIGVYFAWIDRKKGTDEYMMGGGNVGPLPIGCSLAVTFFSAVTVLGTPGEYYLYGTMFTYFLVTYLLCSIMIGKSFIIMRRRGILSYSKPTLIDSLKPNYLVHCIVILG